MPLGRPSDRAEPYGQGETKVTLLAYYEIIGGVLFVAGGIWALRNAADFPCIVAMMPERFPMPLRRILMPVPDPERYPRFYVHNAYAGGAIFVAGGIYIIVSAWLGWG